jgi:hypothetical protein
VDFLLLVSSQYKDHHVALDDACAHCVERIHIEVDHGRLAQVRPEESIAYQGGA